MKTLIEIKEMSPIILKNYSRNPAKTDKAAVLSSLLRNYSICNESEIIESIHDDSYDDISQETGINVVEVKFIVNTFLGDLIRLNEFYRNYTMTWSPDPKKLERRVRCYLHKIHRLAPVFDYDRARINLKVLLKKLRKKVFWPKMSTQICVVIFVTDMNDKYVDNNERLIQKNLRMLCNCSAYAFHRTRNILGINID